MVSYASIALLLEDEPLIAMDLKAILEEAGFSVVTVVSCRDADDWLRMFRPDIAVVDIELRDGPCDRIAEQLIEDGVPFIVHSGDHPSTYAGTPFASAPWIGKPQQAGELASAAQALLLF